MGIRIHDVSLVFSPDLVENGLNPSKQLYYPKKEVKKMPKTSIICGVLLILIGIAGYITGVMSDKASVTALIPAFIGVVLALLGALAGMKEGLRKHLMHAAVIVALIGFMATAGRLISRLSELSASPAVLSQVATAIICLVFVILAIQSFAAARRNGNVEPEA